MIDTKQQIAFTELYSQLNTQQKKAVDTIDGPVMVLAGPGTGKTQVLAVRIANILKQTDTQPQAILALTFTESAAANMRQRLVKLIGTTGYYVRITTFHAFCSSVIQEHPEFFPIERGSQPLTDIERYQMFEDLLTTATLAYLKPLNKQLFYLRDVMSAISDLKREGVSPQDFNQILEREQQLFDVSQEEMTKTQKTKQQKLLFKWQELQQLYETYQQNLISAKRFDFDDMIMFTKQAFTEHAALLLEYQEELHYFLVDEYQDTNSAQNAVVSQLASFWGDQANLFVVGDPHQSIYRFQGASVENTLLFTKQYPHAAVISLEQGYRCPQLVYDAAHHLIQHNFLEEAVESMVAQTSVRLIAVPENKNSNNAITILVANNQAIELLQVVEQIKAKLDSGIDASQIAILYRHNKDAEIISQLLLAEGIPFTLGQGKNALETVVVSQVTTVLEVIASLEQGEVADQLFEVLSYDWFGLEVSIPLKVSAVAAKEKSSIWQVLSKEWVQFSAISKQIITQEEFTQAQQIRALLISWSSLNQNQLLPITLQTIYKDSGLLDWTAKQVARYEILEHLTTFSEFVQSLCLKNRTLTIAGLVTQLKTMQQQNISLPLQEMQTRQSALSLSTVHKAKGQEWEYVFVVHAYDKKWGNARTRNVLPLPTGILQQELLPDADPNQDDRRLFYVACTRAAKELTISYPKELVGEGSTKVVSPSLFITEILEGSFADQILRLEQDLAEQTLLASLEKKLTPATLYTTDSEKDFLRSLVADFSLSVTALNTYLQDPQLFVERHLIRVPRLKADQLAFGTAVHTALELAGKTALESKQRISLPDILSRFTTALQQELLHDDQLLQWRAHGETIISEYYKQVLTSEKSFDPTSIVFVERFFGCGSKTVVLGDIPLVGRIDRVDWLDKTKQQVRVIDYKTGKPKSENYIRGLLASQELSDRERALPESIRGPMKRQLLFYKLLADLDPGFQPAVTHGIFSFIEPMASGKCVERAFELPQNEVEDLKVLIQEVAAEIRSLAF